MPLKDGRETPEEYAERHRRNEERAREYAERKAAHAERQRIWENQQQERERQKEENRQRKLDLILAASLIVDKEDWKTGGRDMADLMSSWKKIKPYSGEDEDGELWNSFNNHQIRFFEKKTAYFADRDRKIQAASNRRHSIIDKLRGLRGSLGTRSEIEPQIKKLRSDFAAAGPFKHGEYEDWWDKFNSLAEAFYVEWKTEERGKFAGYMETARNSKGEVITRVTVGTEGYTHTTPHGKTTGHASGDQHHHGGHSIKPSKGDFVKTGTPPQGSIIDRFIKKMGF